MRHRLLFTAAVVAAISMAGCREQRTTFTDREKALITDSERIMRVLTVDNETDLQILRDSSMDFTDADLRSEYFSRLSELMVKTMQDSTQEGVGIAAPQVGLSRRVVAVQRFDKTGEPVEIYPNIRIESLCGELKPGYEGCLSVPGQYGIVSRYQEIVISYRKVEEDKAVTILDTVRGYTAVIFQHEADHLDGIIYTDKADSLFF